MAQETNQCHSPLLCVAGCGFFGSPGTNGMCSLCYKDFLQRQKMNESSPTIGGVGESLLVENCALPVPTATPLKDIKYSGQGSDVSASATTTAEPLQGVSVVRVGVKPEMLTPLLTHDSSQDSAETEDKPKAKKNRCLVCRKKLGLTGFDCRCGGMFCGIHRYSDEHECSFDYKADAAKRIKKDNPLLVGEKIQKI